MLNFLFDGLMGCNNGLFCLWTKKDGGKIVFFVQTFVFLHLNHTINL